MRLRACVILVPAAVLLSLPMSAPAEWYDDCFFPPDSLGFRQLDTNSDCAAYPFKNIFDLRVQDGLFSTSTLGAWTAEDLSTFMTTIVDADSTTDLDVFSRVWDYLCIADTDPRWDAISMRPIEVRLVSEPSIEWSTPIVLHLRKTELDSLPDPEDVARGVFVHEFGHVLVDLNEAKPQLWADEMWAVAAEALAYGRGENVHPPFFDASLESYIGPVGKLPYAPYQNYDLFWAYIRPNFSGPTPQDDIMYRWVRSSRNYTSFAGLATVLGNDPMYEYLGTTGSECVGALFQRFGMAMYINRPDTLDGIYGLGDYSTEKAHLFDWIDTDGMRARVVPPEFTVGEAQLSPTTTSSFNDTLDTAKSDTCRTKPLGIRRWGMDCLVFKADPEYFATHGDTLLRIELKGTQTAPDGTRLRAAYVTYKSIADTLWKSPIHAIVDAAGATIHEGTAEVGITVQEFGQTVKAVVVMLSLVDDPVEENSRGHDRAVTCWTDIEGSAPDIPYRLTYQLISSQLDVPEKYLEIQNAIDAADPGQIVRVALRQKPYEAFAMKQGVRVERAIGSDPPVVMADSTTCVVVVDFPADSDTLTTLSGFDIQGGTDAIVRLRGTGRIEECTLRADDSQPAAGVLISGGSGLIRDTQILMEESGYATKGIEIHNAAPLVGHCEIHARNGDPQSAGVWADSSAGTVQWSHVTATGQGFHLDGEIEIVNCLVDSTNYEGIYGTGAVTVENSIVERVQNVGYNGIVAPTVRYCIAPDGISAQAAEANSFDDPVYCDPVAHTLRADCYGSPENNPSGRLIGIGNVTCIGDTLTRDTTISRSDLAVVSTIVVPAGTGLTLLPRSGLKFPSGMGIEVNGALTVTGEPSQHILLECTGWATPCWAGVVVGPHAKVKIENADLLGPDRGITDDGAAAADTISLRNVSMTPLTDGIVLNPFRADSTALLTIDHVDIVPMRGPGGRGIYIARAANGCSYNVRLEAVSVEGPAVEKRYGIYLDTPGTMVGGHPPTLRNITLRDKGVGAALTLVNTSATVDSLDVNGWAYGVDVVGGGSPSIRGFSIRDVATGIRTEGATAALIEDGEILADTLGLASLSEGTAAGGDTLRSVFVSGCAEHGVYAEGPAHIVGCTVDSTGGGIVMGNDGVVENCVVTHTGSLGYWGIAAGTARYCIAPEGIGATTEYANSTEDPLYCGIAVRTLRVDSYGNPNNNDSGKLIGKFPVACMGDTLLRNSTFSGGLLDMKGHTTIPADRTLALGAGTTVAVDTTSVPGSGKAEIRVLGTLQVGAAFSGRSSIRSTSQEPGSWGGIRAYSAGAHIVLNSADMYDFETGFTDDGGQIDSLYAADCQFGNFTNGAIFLDASGGGGLVRLLNTSIHMEGAPVGIWIDSGAESYGVAFDSVTVTGDADGEYGVLLNTGAPASDPSSQVNRVRVNGLTTGTALVGGEYCPAIHGGAISGCKTGIWLLDSQLACMEGYMSSPPEISGCTTGLYLSGSAHAHVDDLVIGSIPIGGIGLYTDYSSGGSFTGVSIAGGGTGFKSYGTGAQKFRNGSITGFTTYGVLVGVTSPVDLGVYCDDDGSNNIYSTAGTAKYVYAKNHLGELGQVMAQSNWWGTYPPLSTRFTALTVNFDYALQNLIQMQGRHMSMMELPAVLALTAMPNPSRDRVVVRADFPVPQAAATVEIFNVLGCRVRSLWTGSTEAGRIELSWDGADDRGATLPAGVYFVRLRAGRETRTSRILRIR